MSRKLIILVILLLVSVPAFAQSVDTAWVRRYNGPGNAVDWAAAIGIDGSRNVYVTGWSQGSGTDIDYATIMYHPNGDTAWVRRYNGPSNGQDGARALAVDGFGNVYVTGHSHGSGTVDDFGTIKYYPDGDTAWVRRYNGPGNDHDGAGAIAVDGSGNVYVTGWSAGAGTYPDYFDFATIKYYPDGDTAWVIRYNGPGNDDDKPYAIALDSSGNVYVTGYSVGNGTSRDYATIKYHSNGDTAWVRRYSGPGNDDKAYAITVDGSGNVYVTGQSYGSGTWYDFATIKYYPNGDTSWVRRYNGPSNGQDGARAIAVDGSGSVYVAGTRVDGTLEDYQTVKYYPNGDTAWVRRYNGPGNAEDWAKAIAIDGSGNVYVTGQSVGSGTGYDHATIKYYPNGDTAWVIRYNGPANGEDAAYDIAVDDSGNVYVTGYSVGSATGQDYCTIKYVQNGSEVKDETGSREKPSEFALSQNYPNPFNQATKIEFALEKSGFASLSIYDILGRKVRTLVSEHVSAGYKSVLWDGKNDAGKDVVSGIYFYQLRVGDFFETKKLVLLK